MNGFERAASAGGNLEAGVIVDLPGRLKWPRRRDTRNGIAAVLPIQFTDVVTPEALQQGEGFVRPDEPETQPPVAWLIWQDGVLSAPEDKSVMVIGVDAAQAQTPCPWPAPAPAIVTLAEGGWRLPVISSEALVVARPSDMSVEDILASLGSFPEPGDADSEDEGEEGEEPLTDASDTTEAPPAAYPIRRMMELLVRLCETQARLDPRDWQRWCRELQQNLCAIASREKTMLEFFRNARANPLPALADPRMRPEGVSPDLLRDALLAVSVAWELSAYPSLWEREAA